jgi:putative transcriptional regulator
MKTRMKELREKSHLTQEQLADKVGARRETILFLEKGKYNPSLLLAYRVAKILKSRIEDVFIFEDYELFPVTSYKWRTKSPKIQKNFEK